MNDKDFIEARVNIKNEEVIKKLDILRLERGISSNAFIIRAIVEKLQRAGYLSGGAKKHQTKAIEKQLSNTEQLQKSFVEIMMTPRK